MTALFRPASVQGETAAYAPPVATIPPEALADHYARIVAAHGEELKRHRRRERGGHLFSFVHGCTTVALAVALAALLPLKTIVPVFVHQHADGSFTSTISQDDLPRSLKEATTQATLWLYVRAREGYSSASWHEDQRLVYMLSDKGAGDVYESLVHPRNPESPGRKFGTRTVIRLERVSEHFPCAHDSCLGREPDAYQVRFRRIVHTEGQPPVIRPWVATVRFHRVDRIPAWQRVTYNPLGLQVVEYRAEEEGAQ
jgi:type IV secretion system protein VirB8